MLDSRSEERGRCQPAGFRCAPSVSVLRGAIVLIVPDGRTADAASR